MKVIFCTPTRDKPHPAYVKALEESLPLLEANGIEHGYATVVGNPYISGAMAECARKALDAKPDALIFIDDDVSWTPESLLALIQCDKEVVGGTYRFKKDEVEYMGCLHTDSNGRPIGEFGGPLKAKWLPSGFLKISVTAVDKFMKAYPHLNVGPAYHPTPDLFNHGAHEGVWYGQDYAFCRNYAEKCGEVFLLPNLNIHHHKGEEIYRGNFHEFLASRPGGSKSENPEPPVSRLADLAKQLQAA